jgi:hypothetical protein
MRYVNVYAVQRSYGGPEEGGWWYDVGTVEQSVPAATDADVDRLVDALALEFPTTGHRYSVLGGEDWDVVVENKPASDWIGSPGQTHMPRYE